MSTATNGNEVYEQLRAEFGDAVLTHCRAIAEIPADQLEEITQEIGGDEDGEITHDEIIRRWQQRQKLISKLDSVTAEIADRGHRLNMTEESLRNIAACGFRGDNLALALVATDILLREKPVTLRGLMYRLVSAGWLPSTDATHYTRTGRLMTRLREEGLVPYHWIVDGVRSTIKPSSWAGIGDFADTVRDAYRMDFWSQLPAYVHIICEKDAVAGTLSPVTRKYDVALSPIRGYCSLSFAYEIGSVWNETEKPIYCYYLGDYDPSGFDLERDIREKLERHTADSHPEWVIQGPDDPMPDVSHDSVVWTRLGVNQADFDDWDLLPLKIKKDDKRASKFRDEHGDKCAELDAIPSSELRRRVRDAIESHIPQDEWVKLQEIEQIERDNFNQLLDQLPKSQ